MKEIFVKIEAEEIACLIAEGLLGRVRPPGASAKDAMKAIEKADRRTAAHLYAAARKVAEYLVANVNSEADAAGSDTGAMIVDRGEKVQ